MALAHFGDLRSRVNDHFGRSLAQLSSFPSDPFDVADRLMQLVGDEFKTFNRDLMGPMQTQEKDIEKHRRLAMWVPAVDVRESADAFHFHCDLPGVKKEDIQVQLTSILNCHDSSSQRWTSRGISLCSVAKENWKRRRKTKSGSMQNAGVVSAKRQVCMSTSVFSEGSFCRSFNLPAGTQKDDIAASYADGVLQIKVKKNPQVEQQSRIMIE